MKMNDITQPGNLTGIHHNHQQLPFIAEIQPPGGQNSRRAAQGH